MLVDFHSYFHSFSHSSPQFYYFSHRIDLIKEGFLEPMNKPMIEEDDDDEVESVSEKKVGCIL